MHDQNLPSTAVPNVAILLKAAQAVNNGGRALNAIWYSEDLDAEETSIMMYLGSQLNFNREFTESIPRTVGSISKRTKLSERTVRRRLNDLAERGYIVKTSNFNNANGRQCANNYALTDKIFQDHLTYLTEKYAKEGRVTDSQGEAVPQSGGRVTDSQGEGDCVTANSPSYSSPGFNPPSSMTGCKNSQPFEREGIPAHKDPRFVGPAMRLEFCYKSSDDDYVWWEGTCNLVKSILENHGQERLNGFLRWTERRWEELARENPRYKLPARRMDAHWEDFLSLELAKPDTLQ